MKHFRQPLVPGGFIAKSLFLLLTSWLSSCHMGGSEQFIYIDPGSHGTDRGNGSAANPYTSWEQVKMQSNTTYYIKRSSQVVLNEPTDIHKKTNITIAAYGEGRMPLFHTGNLQKPFDIIHSQQINLHGIAFSGGDKSSYCLRIIGESSNINIRDCHFSQALWGIRIIGNPDGHMPKQIYIANTTVQETGDDGIFAQHASNLHIDSCHIRRVNQNWFKTGRSESQASGDAIQLYKCRSFTIKNNRLDRSDTGNKFALIASQSQNGLVSNNIIVGPSTEGKGGACIYLGKGSDNIHITDNILQGSRCGIYSHAGNIVFTKNTLTNNMSGGVFLDTRQALVINNTFWKNIIMLRGSNLEIFNNIFYSTGQKREKAFNLKAPYNSDYNCYFPLPPKQSSNLEGALLLSLKTDRDKHSIYSDPLLAGKHQGGFLLTPSSPCIDQGTTRIERWGLLDDYCGKSVDIGASEYCPKEHKRN
jgi:parallel beta-helix repeat protein